MVIELSRERVSKDLEIFTSDKKSISLTFKESTFAVDMVHTYGKTCFNATVFFWHPKSPIKRKGGGIIEVFSLPKENTM